MYSKLTLFDPGPTCISAAVPRFSLQFQLIYYGIIHEYFHERKRSNEIHYKKPLIFTYFVDSRPGISELECGGLCSPVFEIMICVHKTYYLTDV